MDNLSAGSKPEPLHDVGAIRLGLHDLLIRMTERPHLESLTEVLRLALHR
jgi:hypothetical protein